MLNARTFRETVTLYSETKTEDNLGELVSTETSHGSFPASVDVATGSKAIYYQEKGFGHSVTIIVRATSFNISRILWGNISISPRSIVKVNNDKKSDTRGQYYLIEGGYNDDKG